MKYGVDCTPPSCAEPRIAVRPPDSALVRALGTAARTMDAL